MYVIRWPAQARSLSTSDWSIKHSSLVTVDQSVILSIDIRGIISEERFREYNRKPDSKAHAQMITFPIIVTRQKLDHINNGKRW